MLRFAAFARQLCTFTYEEDWFYLIQCNRSMEIKCPEVTHLGIASNFP